MTTTTWKGTISGDYATPANWDDGVPGNGVADLGIFNGNGVIKTITVGSATQVNEWHFDGGAYSVAISARVDISETIAVSAGSATIRIQNGGTLAFNNDAAGGNCQFIADFNGLVDFTVTVGAHGFHTVSAASIAGAGSFDLGKQELTVGSDNSSTEVSGSIGGDFGCSLVKVGTGTLTLSGNNGFFVGPMTIAAGTLDLDSISAPGLAGQIHFAAGTQTLRIEAAALSSNNFSATIVSFGPGDTIDLNDLPFVPGATATFNKSLFTLTVKSGATTVSFDTIDSPARTHFAALGDHTGGTRVVLAIVGTAAANVIDAGHHPAAQPPPNGAPDVILGLGGNDVLSGLGGADILVGGAGKDSLSGGLAGDAFVFQKLSDSTVGHADTIADFRAAQHDKIDLYDIDADQRAAAPGNQAFVFIGTQTFAHYHAAHHSVFGMVRFAGGVLQGNVNVNLGADFAIVVHGATALHPGDFAL